MTGLALLLLAVPDGRAALHLVDCVADPGDFTATIAIVGPTDTVEISAGPCDLGATTVELVDGITLVGDGRQTLRGSADPMFRVSAGANTFEGLRLETTSTNGALAIDVGGTTLRDLELAGQPDSAPAIVVAGGVGGTTLEGVVVTGFQGNGRPGGLDVQGGASVTVTDSRFEGLGGSAGGAVRVEDDATLVVIRTVFCGNVTTDPGAGIQSNGGHVTVSASQFSANDASDGGSAIAMNGGTLAASHVDFVGNLGSSAIESDVAVTVESSLLYENDGVAIDAPGGSTVEYDLFEGNGSLGVPLGFGSVTGDPQVVAWAGGGCGADDLRPDVGSPLLGGGDPGDPVANIGQYGGADARPGWDDVDGDGDPYLDDCEDEDPLIGPSRVDVCGDGIDSDCTGLADDDPTQVAGLFEDADGDGFGDGLVAATSCATAVADGTDCNDLSDAMYPGAVEVCDHADDDCDAVIDDVAAAPWWGPDLDGDGVGTMTEQRCFPSDPTFAEALPPAGDCRDDLPEVRPGLPEVCYDGYDTDCDPATSEVGGTPLEWYPDADQDGFGEAGAYREALTCANPGGLVPAPLNTDCADTEAYVNPGRPEICNGIDDDCDLLADEDDPDLRTDPWYPDLDGDGAGDRFGVPVLACGALADGFSANADDCDDRDGSRVGSLEVWPDADGDGYGNGELASILVCFAPPGHADEAGDCNDGNPTANPGLDEVAGDGVDNDCDGSIDELVTTTPGGGSGRPTAAPTSGAAGCGCSGLPKPRPGGGAALPALLALALLRARRSRLGAPTG